jgi:hypothetical protein
MRHTARANWFSASPSALPITLSLELDHHLGDGPRHRLNLVL